MSKDIQAKPSLSCDKSCGPGDYYKGGKCDLNGCYVDSSKGGDLEVSDRNFSVKMKALVERKMKESGLWDKINCVNYEEREALETKFFNALGVGFEEYLSSSVVSHTCTPSNK